MDDPIRIGYVLDRYPKYSEGIIVNEILAHEAAGLDIEIFSLRPPRDSYFHEPLFRVQAPVHYLPENPVLAQEFWRVLGSVLKKFPGLQNNLSVTKGESHLDVFQSLALAKLALNNGITHLHAHGGVDTLSVAHMASCFLGFPLSLTLHGQDLNPLHRNHQALQKKIKAAAAVIAYSQFEEAFLTSRLGVNPCKITRTCNGLDLEDLPFHPPTPGQQDILAIGPLIPQKGWECLIRACRILEHNRGEVRCRIIGTGEEESYMRYLIRELGLEDRVTLEGLVTLNQLREWQQQAALLVVPARSSRHGFLDGLPLEILEAMAVGTPCVAGDMGAIPEMVRDGETGFLVPPGEPVPLANTLESALNDFPLRQQVARKSRALVESRFNIKINAAALRVRFEKIHQRTQAGVVA